MQLKNPVAGLVGNGLLLAEQSFMPPILPGASAWGQWRLRAIPDWLNASFPRLMLGKPNELPGEEGAGLGLGITLPLLVGLVVSLANFRQSGSLKKIAPPVAAVLHGQNWIGSRTTTAAAVLSVRPHSVSIAAGAARVIAPRLVANFFDPDGRNRFAGDDPFRVATALAGANDFRAARAGPSRK